MAESYYDLLRRPEWQRKRLEVMEAAGFKCQSCGAASKTLNVHHRWYAKGAKPWEYEDTAYQCLCEECHESRHQIATAMKVVTGYLDHESELPFLLGYAKALALLGRAETDVPRFVVLLPAEAAGVATALGAKAGEFTLETITGLLGEDGRIGRKELDLIRAALSERAG